MAETYDSLTDTRAGTTVVVRVEFPGIPHKLSGIDAGGADGDGSTAYSVRPLSLVSSQPANYSAQQRVGYKATLSGVRFSPEKIDQLSGKTTIGSVGVTFIDPDGTFANLVAVRGRSKLGSLAADVSRTASSVTLNSGNTVAAGQAVFLGREMMVANGTGTTITVTRGDDAAGARERKHTASTDAEQHADNLYDGPRIWVGQELNVYLGYDHPDLDETSELGPLRFTISAPPQRKASGEWSIKADSYLKVLDKRVFVDAFAGKMRVGQPISETPTIPITATSETSATGPAFNSADDVVYLDIEGEAAQATLVESYSGYTLLRLDERGLFGTKLATLEPGEPVEVHEVIPTDEDLTTPRIGHVASPYSGSLVASSHPLVAFLCLLLSQDGIDGDGGSGSDRNANSGANSYDVLPPPMGAAFPAELVDQTTFERVIEETAHVRFRRFRLGREGAFSLREWFDREVAPFIPYSLHMGLDGKLTLVTRADPYPFDEAVSFTADHIDEDYHDWTLSSAGALGRVTAEYVDTDGVEVELNGLSVLIRDLFPDGTKTIKHESDGADERAESVLIDALINVITQQEFPSPVVRFRGPWSLHDAIEPGTKVLVTDPAMPSGSGGSYGVTEQAWVCTSSNITSPTQGKPGIEWVGRRAVLNSAHFGPAGLVKTWTKGTLTLTIDTNSFAPSSAEAPVVDADIKGFGDDGSQGSVGYIVSFYDDNGVLLTKPVEATSLGYSGDSMVLADAPEEIGSSAGYDPVPDADFVRLTPYTSSISAEVAAGTAHAELAHYAYLGDSDTEEIHSGEPNREWGW